MQDVIHEVLNDNLEVFFLSDGTSIKVIKQENLSKIASVIEYLLLKDKTTLP